MEYLLRGRPQESGAEGGVGGREVGGREVGTHHSEDGERDDRREGGVGGVGAGIDVWVAGLVELQHAEAGDHVHEGGV